MDRRRLATIASLSLATACSLPGRDNPFDPTNRPVASLKFVDLGQAAPDGSCPPPGATTDEVGAAPRSHCVGLDARGSHDPQRTPTLEFALVDGAGQVIQPLVQATYGFVALSSQQRLSLPIGAPLRFRVHAEDPVDHGSAEAFAQGALLDSPPSVGAQAPRSIAAGGAPWAPGMPVDVPFVARNANDAEDDPLRYCFTFPPSASNSSTETVCSQDPADPAFHRLLVASAGTYDATLVVYDNSAGLPALASRPATSLVRIGEPALWLAVDEQRPFDELDSLRQDYYSTPQRVPTALLDGGSAPVVAAAYSATDQVQPDLHVFDWPNATRETTTPIGTDFLPTLVGDAARNRIWWFGRLGGSTPMIRAFDVGPGSTGVTAGPTLLLTGADLGLGDFLTVDARGELWAASLLDSSIAVVTSSGDSFVDLGDPARAVAGLAARPGTDEVWETDASAGGGRLVRFGATEHSWSLTGPDAGAIAWIDHDRLWLLDPARGLLLLDATALDAGASIENATLTLVPEILQAYYLVADPLSGTAWATDIAAARVCRAAPDGTSECRPGAEDVSFVDRQGALWYTDEGGARAVRRGLTTGPDGVVRYVDANAFANEAGPSITGDMWAVVYQTDLGASVLDHVLEDGSIAESIEALVTTDGAIAAVPRLQQAQLDPTGTKLWGADPAGGFVTVDLGSRPPVVRTFRDGAAIQEVIPSAPPQAGNPFAWAYRKTSPDRLVTEDADGNETFVAFVPTNEKVAFAARSLADDDLCVASVKTGSPNTLHVRRYSTSGAVSINYQTSSTAVGTLRAVGADADVCWVGFDDALPSIAPTFATLLAIDRSSSVRHQQTFSGYGFRALAPRGADRVWASLAVDAANADVRRLDWSGAGGTATQTDLGPMRSSRAFWDLQSNSWALP